MERTLLPGAYGEEPLVKWVLVSGCLHIMLVISLFLSPYLPARSTPEFPVYTVDLVGGERIGGNNLSTELKPPPPKEIAKKAEPPPPPPVKEVKKEIKKETKAEKKKPPEKTEPVRDQVVLKEPVKKEPVKKETAKETTETKAESETEEALPDRVREKLIQAALERVRSRAESAQKSQKTEPMSTGPGEGQGAAALGPGGRGGGIVKGIEFLVYRNRMLHLIREHWAWVGRRSDLEVTVQFGVRENGEIVGLKIVQASGDFTFDDSVIRAVRKTSPLPPPPENYRRDFMDVELTFRPKDLGG